MEIQISKKNMITEDQKVAIDLGKPVCHNRDRSNATHSVNVAAISGNKSYAIRPVRVSPYQKWMGQPSRTQVGQIC